MNCFTSLANIQILFDDPTIGYLPGAYSLGNGLLDKIFSAVFETDVEFTRNFAFRIERSAEPQSTAFYIVHPLLRELLCSEIYQGFHDRSFWVRNSLFSDFCFSTDIPQPPFSFRLSVIRKIMLPLRCLFAF